MITKNHGGNAPAAPTASGASDLEKRVSKLESLVAELQKETTRFILLCRKKTNPEPKPERRFYESMSQCSSVLQIPMAAIKSAKLWGCRAFRGSRIEIEPLKDFMQGLRWNVETKSWHIVFTGPEFIPTDEQKMTILRGIWD